MLDKIKLVVWLMLILLTPLVEVGTTIALTQTMGAVSTFLIFAASNIIGFAALWFSWQKLKPYWKENWNQVEAVSQLDEEGRVRQSEDPESQNRVTKALSVLFSFLFSVFLFLTPGFFTDLLAFYLIYSLTRTIDDPMPQVS